MKKLYDWSDLNKLVKEVLNKCETCKKYNSKSKKQFIHVASYYPGEKVAIDIVGPIKDSYIISGIDYFSRKGWASVIKSRDGQKVLKFLKHVHSQLNIKMLVLDQSKENLRNDVKKWAEENNVLLHYTSPFHHQSNGRVERFNRTLQEGVFKQTGRCNLKQKIKKVLDVYNNVMHSSIGCTPNEAMDLERRKSITKLQYYKFLKMTEKYDYLPKEERLQVGDSVIIKEIVGKNKGDPKFKTRGKILENLGNNSYMIKLNDKSTVKRHASHLKCIIDWF